MTYPEFQIKSLTICMALGYLDVRTENAPHVIQFYTQEMLNAVVDNKVKFYCDGEHWTDWFVAMCKVELKRRVDDQLDMVILG